MRGSWKLGEAAGIGVFVHWSFLILPAWIVLATLFAGGSLTAAVGSVGFLLAVFGCVGLHELGHALMARRFRIVQHLDLALDVQGQE